MAWQSDDAHSTSSVVSNASLHDNTSSKFLDWKKVKEFVSSASVIGEDITHEDKIIIGTENIKAFFNTKHKYCTKLTKRKNITSN